MIHHQRFIEWIIKSRSGTFRHPKNWKLLMSFSRDRLKNANSSEFIHEIWTIKFVSISRLKSIWGQKARALPSHEISKDRDLSRRFKATKVCPPTQQAELKVRGQPTKDVIWSRAVSTVIQSCSIFLLLKGFENRRIDQSSGSRSAAGRLAFPIYFSEFRFLSPRSDSTTLPNEQP